MVNPTMFYVLQCRIRTLFLPEGVVPTLLINVVIDSIVVADD